MEYPVLSSARIERRCPLLPPRAGQRHGTVSTRVASVVGDRYRCTGVSNEAAHHRPGLAAVARRAQPVDEVSPLLCRCFLVAVTLVHVLPGVPLAQGETCSICGHKGKGKIYQMLADMPCDKGLNFRFFDQRTNVQWFKGYWALALIIRR